MDENIQGEYFRQYVHRIRNPFPSDMEAQQIYEMVCNENWWDIYFESLRKAPERKATDLYPKLKTSTEGEDATTYIWMPIEWYRSKYVLSETAAALLDSKHMEQLVHEYCGQQKKKNDYAVKPLEELLIENSHKYDRIQLRDQRISFQAFKNYYLNVERLNIRMKENQVRRKELDCDSKQHIDFNQQIQSKFDYHMMFNDMKIENRKLDELRNQTLAHHYKALFETNHDQLKQGDSIDQSKKKSDGKSEEHLQPSHNDSSLLHRVFLDAAAFLQSQYYEMSFVSESESGPTLNWEITHTFPSSGPLQAEHMLELMQMKCLQQNENGTIDSKKVKKCPFPDQHSNSFAGTFCAGLYDKNVDSDYIYKINVVTKNVQNESATIIFKRCLHTVDEGLRNNRDSNLTQKLQELRRMCLKSVPNVRSLKNSVLNWFNIEKNIGNEILNSKSGFLGYAVCISLDEASIENRHGDDGMELDLHIPIYISKRFRGSENSNSNLKNLVEHCKTETIIELSPKQAAQEVMIGDFTIIGMGIFH